MKLVLDPGFRLDTTAPDYRDRVLDMGKHAEAPVLAFMKERKIASRRAGAILKHLRTQTLLAQILSELEHAARTFLKSLKAEEVLQQYLETCMLRGNGPLILEAVVDKFGMYLAFKGGRKGKILARHSAMQYFRQAKSWML
ncbi:hypothetical protein PHMEG_00011601 [Phytophthora megakarya]|uniref:Uncharacterized protein n=1 Tax=Phytophthora megakarya TaxID=4795 RepID=A0A225WBA3_9STRA|nr:hypothetical protein PHMEG_00011601 [Phytophthora megakarya]